MLLRFHALLGQVVGSNRLAVFRCHFASGIVFPSNAEADLAEEQSSEAAFCGIQWSQRCPSCGH